MQYPSELAALIAHLRKLPGVGSKTAERFAFHLLTWQESQLGGFATLIATIKEKISYCQECGCLAGDARCFFCENPQRDKRTICIVSSAKEVFSLEETGIFKGLYHVLGGLLSPLQGCSPEHLQLSRLQDRVAKEGVDEVIIALDSTLEGDTTALFLKEQLGEWGVKASRLAFGLPIGSTLEFVDAGTLSRALIGRQAF